MAEKYKYTYLLVEGLKHGQQISENTENKIFMCLRKYWLHPISKLYPLRVFSLVIFLF